MKTTLAEETRDTTARIDPGQPLSSIDGAREVLFIPMGRHGVFHLRDDDDADGDEPVCGADSDRMRLEPAARAAEIGYAHLIACTNCTQPIEERNERDCHEEQICKKCGEPYKHLARHLPHCDGRDRDAERARADGGVGQ